MTASPDEAVCCPETTTGLIDFGDDQLETIPRLVRAAAFNLLLDTGRPAGLEAIASQVGVSVGVAENALGFFSERGSVQVDGANQVVGIAGLSVEPTRHRIVLPQGERWTWCALDAVGIVAAVGVGAIHSDSRGGVFHITYQMDRFDPADVAVFIADGYGMTSSIRQWCPLVDLFPSCQEAALWADRHGVEGSGVEVAAIATLAGDRWQTIIEGG